jgi:hypothetical protein
MGGIPASAVVVEMFHVWVKLALQGDVLESLWLWVMMILVRLWMLTLREMLTVGKGSCHRHETTAKEFELTESRMLPKPAAKLLEMKERSTAQTLHRRRRWNERNPSDLLVTANFAQTLVPTIEKWNARKRYHQGCCGRVVWQLWGRAAWRVWRRGRQEQTLWST